MTDQNKPKTPSHSPGMQPPNDVRRVEVLARLPIECGCVYEVSGEGDLPVTVVNGRIFVDPVVLHEFLHQAATGLTMAYGELVLETPACPPKPGPADVVAPSTTTPH